MRLLMASKNFRKFVYVFLYKKPPKEVLYSFGGNFCINLQKRDVMFEAGYDHILGPDGGLNLADVGFLQQQHAEAALPDAAAHAQG